MTILYCEKIENHRIGNRTPFVEVANSLGWTLTIEESQTEKAYDGSLWEKGYTPEKPQELLTEEKRNERNRLLDATDKYMVSDYPLSKEEKAKYKKYRKYLRDITKDKAFPNIEIKAFENFE